MSKAEKVEYIRTALETVDEYTLEQIYEFLLEMEYWKEVIRNLIGFWRCDILFSTVKPKNVC